MALKNMLAASWGCPSLESILGVGVEPLLVSRVGGVLNWTGGSGGSSTSLSFKTGLGATAGGIEAGDKNSTRPPGRTGVM